MAQITGVFRIGRDAELRHTPKGDAVAQLSLAYNHGKKGQDGSRPSQWIDASIWGKRAESLAPYLLKGQQIYAVLSDPHIQTYEGKNGQGVKLVATVLEIELIAGQRQQDGQPQRQERPKPAPAPANPGSFADMDDDIPFNDPMKRRAYALSV
jgi:single-strand DNA-binding protein